MQKINNIKGVHARYIIHEILYAIKYQNINFDQIYERKKKERKLKASDYNLINDVVLSSMRLFLYVNKIIDIYSKKKPKKHQYILLLSSVTQLVFLNYQNYAVINCAVEIAKNKKINAVPGFINSILKKIDQNKSKLKNITLDNKLFDQLTNKHIFKDLTFQKKIKVVESASYKPQTHIVFKKNINTKNLSFKIDKTTSASGILQKYDSLNKIKEFKKGEFWIQDFSSMIPLYLTKIQKNSKCLDMCAAPGGKTFQLIQNGANVCSVEKKIKRAEKLRLNLDRLNYKAKINIIDALNLNEKDKYEIVILDAPCSSIGTIRRNPDIIFRDKKIDLQIYSDIQKKLLQKASNMVTNGGMLIYLVCSFLNYETYKPIEDFLKKNKNFSILRFNGEKQYSTLIDKKGFINILPQRFNNFLIDGFFAAKLIKND